MKKDLTTLLAERDMTKAELAKRLNIGKSSITMWEQRRVPAERVLQLERITRIPRYVLRPDLYPKEKSGKSRD